MSSKRGERRMQDFGLGSEFKKGSKRGGELVRYLEKKPSVEAGGKPEQCPKIQEELWEKTGA